MPHLHIRASGEANSKAERRAYQSHIRLIICCVTRLAIRGARSRSGFLNMGQSGRMAICVMCTNM